MTEEIEFMNSLMEEMAGDKGEYGKRQPGERCMYEIDRRMPLEGSRKPAGEFKSDSGMEVAGEW